MALLEWRPTGHDLADGTVAVEFVFDSGRFRIVNALDENDIELGDADPNFIRYPLGTL